MIVVRLFLWLIILGVLASPVVAWYGLDDAPLVTESAKVNVRDIQSAKDFLNQYDPRNLPDGRITTITANQGQINTALAAALAAVPGLKARIVPSRFGLLAAITGQVPIPDNPFGKYVNISMLVESSTTGLKIGRLSIGEIKIPTAIVRPVFILVMDQVAGPGRGKAFLETIRSVQVTGSQVRVVYRPKDGLLDELKTAAKKTVVAGDATITRIYWEALHDIHRRTPTGARVSLTQYLPPMFALAKRRSAGGNAIEENKGAIFALAMFFGDIRIERFVGKVRQGEYTGPPRKLGHVRLQGRHDWVQHYLLSAGLALAGGRGIADFIGEIKEVQDATNKVSGFSFTDIAADRAGVRFAEVATGSVDGAREVQNFLSRGISESQFFPEIRDLPEGLTDAQFKSRYGERESAAYKRQIADIDRRIAQIPLYR
ncbi:MAG: hypothetical protein ACPGRZ_03785 [Alphaproteobacteria bacterium]